MKPQAGTATPTPPQFGHDGIDPLRALLILGLPLAATAVTLLVLFASPLVWWIAAGVAAVGVAGGVLVRRSGRARGLLRRLPGGGRIRPPGVRRTGDGRFARSPLGRVFNRVLGRRPSASPGGSPSRPKTLGGRLRSMLPAWAGGTRPKRPGGTSGGGPGGRPPGRLRSMLSRLKPGGGRRPGSSGSPSPGGARTKPKGLLGRAASSVRRATGRASRAVGSSLFRIRPKPSPSGGGGSGKPSGRGKNKPPGGGKGTDSKLDLGLVWTGAGKAGRLVGRGAGALFRRWRNRKKTDTEDDFDPDSTYEIGIEGEVVDGKHTDAELGEVAKRARKLAKRRAKEAKKKAEEDAKKAPEWPNLDADDTDNLPPPSQGPQPPPEPERPPDYEPEIGDEDYDDHDDQAAEAQRQSEQSSPAQRDHDPPPSPPSHRETRGEEPRTTSTNDTHGGKTVSQQQPKITQQSTPSGISAANYKHHIRTDPQGRATGWGDAADHARRDAVSFDEKADKKINAAEEFERTGNQAAAAESRQEAAVLREDASTCRTIASGYQTEANDEADSAA